MANIRELKREINDLTYELVSDCFTYLLVNEKKNEDKVVKIVSETVSLRNDFIARVNRIKKGGNAAGKKADYKKIKEDLCSGMNKGFEELSKISKK